MIIGSNKIITQIPQINITSDSKHNEMKPSMRTQEDGSGSEEEEADDQWEWQVIRKTEKKGKKARKKTMKSTFQVNKFYPNNSQ